MADPSAAQVVVFRRLLAEGAQTRFGREHGLDPRMTLADYRAAVPVRRYAEFVDAYIHPIFFDNAPDVLWPGEVTCFAESSGTSGFRKLIPLPDDALDWLYRETGALYVANLAGRVDARRFVRGRTIFFAGLAHPAAHNPASAGRGHHCDQRGAYALGARPLSRPRPGHRAHPHREERLAAMARRTVDQEIVHLAGNPAWLRHFVRIVLAETGQPTLRAVWPNLLADSRRG